MMLRPFRAPRPPVNEMEMAFPASLLGEPYPISLALSPVQVLAAFVRPHCADANTLAMGRDALDVWSRFLLDHPDTALLVMQRYCAAEFSQSMDMRHVTRLGTERPLRLEELLLETTDDPDKYEPSFIRLVQQWCVFYRVFRRAVPF